MGTIRAVTSASEIILEILCLSQVTRVIAENARHRQRLQFHQTDEFKRGKVVGLSRVCWSYSANQS